MQIKETQRIKGLTEIVALRIGIPLKAAWSLVNIHQINQQLRIQRLSHYNPRIQLLREEFPAHSYPTTSGIGLPAHSYPITNGIGLPAHSYPITSGIGLPAHS